MKPALVAKFKKLEGRRLGEFTFIVWAAGTLYVAYLIAGYFFLIYIYGYSRVRGDDPGAHGQADGADAGGCP